MGTVGKMAQTLILKINTSTIIYTLCLAGGGGEILSCHVHSVLQICATNLFLKHSNIHQDKILVKNGIGIVGN